MLSWSSIEQGEPADLAAVATGHDGVGLPLGDELVRFASACAGDDERELATARSALVDASDIAFMIDAAAVAANFEMMTRLADGTGAAMPAARVEGAADVIGAMGAAGFTSRR